MNIKYIKTTDNKKYDLRDKRITDTDTGIATQSANGLLSSGDKKKLDGIASGAEVNQNAFSNIKIGNTTISADGKTDTVELTAGNNITLTPDATNDKITIAATDTNTTYTFKGGTNQFTVTPSNGTAQTVSVTPSIANNVTGSDLTANTIILGNGNSGVKKSGKTIVTTLGSDDTTLPTSKAVKAAIDALPEPMIFKGTLGTNGTITSLPTAAASNEGYTYKVITAGTYASQSAKIGDVFISNGSSWNLIPSGDEPSGTVTNIATGTGLTGGPITSSGTISHADTSSQASVSNSGRTYIQSITLDDMGHVTGITSATETVTNTDTKVTSAANHYAPTEDTSSQLDADASSTTAATWNSTSLVTGVTVKRDSKGHVVGLGVDSIKMPANPNTDTKVRQILTSNNWELPLLMACEQNIVPAPYLDNTTYRNNSIYANPSTGTITAKLKGNIYGQFLRRADVETVSAERYVYVKLGTFDYNAFGTLCVHLEGDLIKDELYINYGSGNAYRPLVCGWYASHDSSVKEIDIVYGKSWNDSCELWLKVRQRSTLNIAVFRTIRGDGFTVNTAANWSATTTSPTFNKTVPLIIGMFGDLSGNASSASKLTTNAGSATQPVYFKQGVPTACSYQLNKTVPSNAVFTDTTYSSKSEASGGTDVSLVTTGEKYTWNHKSNLTLGNTASTALAGNTKYAGSSTQGGAATSAEKLTNTSNIGNTNQPVYFTTGGVPTAISYTINKSVPSNAVFTDTHYTTHLYAGSGTAANAATANGNTKLTVVDNTTTRNSVTIKGTGGTTVTSDANGVVTINSTDVYSKQFNFASPSKQDGGFYFIICPLGTNKNTPGGTCYSIEINAVLQSSAGNYVASSAKFVTCCYWYASNAGLRTTSPIYKNSVVPIYYHDKAEGTGVGTETGSNNVCSIPFRIENVESLIAVNIKVEGPDVSECYCSRSYTHFGWSEAEPGWSAI